MKKFIKIFELEKKGKTNIYEVRSSIDDEYLGEIRWYTPWRQYVFETEGSLLLSYECNKQLSDKLHFFNIQQRQGKHGKIEGVR